MQVNALFRKNATYQKRRLCTNCVTVLLPIFFILLLFTLQMYIDSLIDTRDNKCGCLCTQCCTKDTGICRDANASTPCDTSFEECKEYNDNLCGIEYSEPEQVGFCSIEHPISWPAALQTPTEKNRVYPGNPSVTVLYTGKNEDIANTLASSMLKTLSFDDISNNFNDLSLNFLEESENTFRGEMLSISGLYFGTAAGVDLTLYIESAYVNDDLYVITKEYEEEECAELGDILDMASDLIYDQVMSLIGIDINNDITTNTTEITSISTSTETSNSSSSSSNEDNNTVETSSYAKCVNATFIFESEERINENLFCTYPEARCNSDDDERNGVKSENGKTKKYMDSFDFRSTDRDKFDLIVWHEEESDESNGDLPQFERINLSINLALNAWLKYVFGDDSGYSAQLLAVMDVPKPESSLVLELSSLFAPLLYTWILQLLLPLMLVQLVYEKENSLRIMMKMHGLGDLAYWSVSYLYYFFIYLIYGFIVIFVSSLVDIATFRNNSYGVQVIFLFLFGNVQIAFAFLLSSLFRKERTAMIFSFLFVFGSGLIGSLLFETLIPKDKAYNYIIELLPCFGLYRGLYELSQYGFRAGLKTDVGLTWDSFDEENNHMGYVFIIFTVEWFLFMLIAWYLEQVLSSGTGVQRSPLFFIDWIWNTNRRNALIRKLSKKTISGHLSFREHVALDLSDGGEKEPGDVERERTRIEKFNAKDCEEHAIIIESLRKVFPTTEGNPPKVAVNNLTLAIKKGEVFGLLGPNGAGKTTTINMLIGFLSPTEGRAIIEGLSIEDDMLDIYKMMGVCPQHDLLWSTLSGYEHLLFYGRLKGLNDEELKNAAIKALKSVNLYDRNVGYKLVKKYSGGMKRRLSVAISLIGNPKVVYLDEPSTGLDPSSRRSLWNVVKESRKDKAIILTTHNMDEAEELCDRLGIFVNGKLVVIDNPKALTARFAGYLIFSVTTNVNEVQVAENLIMKMFPNSRQTYKVSGTLKFELLREEANLSQVFQFMDDIKNKIQIIDWGVSNATLEEVFIKIAKEAGAKSNELT